MEPMTDLDVQVHAIEIPQTAASVLIVAREVIFYGFSLREATGLASADVDLIHGAAAGGTVIATVALNAGESIRDNYGGHRLTLPRGLSLKVNAGSVRGAVLVAYT